MKDVIIKQPFAPKAKYITVLTFVVWIAVVVWLFIRSSGTFLPAWFILQSLAFFFLIWISRPKKLILYQERLLLVCTIRLVSIYKEEIESIDCMSSKAFPIFSTMGFMGYFGIYFVKSEKCFAEAFARSWKNLIIVRCVSGKKYLIGVDNVEDFLKNVETIWG